MKVILVSDLQKPLELYDWIVYAMFTTEKL